MRTATLDIGNTAVKYGYFEGNELRYRATGQTLAEVLALVQLHQPTHAIVGSVAEPTTDWAAALRPLMPGQVLELAPATTRLPLRNGYATPHTLGADRLAAAVGAAWLHPNQDVLVIDAGTAIKCDFIEGGHTFRGGSIGPGLRLRFQALHTFTGRLPLLEVPNAPSVAVPLIGDDTQSAIRSGVLNGAAAEVNGLIDTYRVQYPELAVLLTGGDAGFFQPRLKGYIFAIPELVLLGLHRILVHNVEN
ncbi:type III pantothenate kinase [Hymenobacter sp. BT507]|uniref:Type III pantothenate kinase n=1 Tax=Hymenobacter citatus TaxID=2763506 RepID=A0ABR7MMK3_9BACT|nr:type III pantothenate kinase [Hymenobacter citatus]MBC6612309.1 type III pantothenate kinase [Hymenobacter citatus]